ncbi:hypothetical protein [Pseudoalteromonas piscicida]|uniref:Adhesin domain-containing protein n=1 Tax=Pseudoalteromonas piscicida TaxID=43662 RepID=A0A2A5JNA1_PSEO7|nr:hypothetical protein [Pseudoalteromonas piscicida]PCK30857.1 hypothetical protein CEX98_15415 [Pseudoalteromonas piscicida]
MKKIALALALSTAAMTTQAAETKTITASFPSNGLTELEVDIAVGKIDLQTYNGDSIEVEILVEPKDSDSWFGNTDVNDAQLTNKTSTNKLALEVNSDDYELSWQVKVPANLALDIEVGVGKIDIDNLNNSADLEVGVGKIKITSTAVDFKEVSLDSGVGKTAMSGYQNSATSEKSMVGSKTNYTGKGQYSIDAEVGVGNIKLRRD